jgi:hypothetical protein
MVVLDQTIIWNGLYPIAHRLSAIILHDLPEVAIYKRSALNILGGARERVKLETYFGRGQVPQWAENLGI